MTSTRLLCLSLVLCALVMSSPSRTQSLSTPFCRDSRTPIDRLPFFINSSGSYFVARHLVGVVGTHGIEVDADDVTIDLNGYTMEGVPGSLDGIHCVSGVRLAVLNGTLRDWGGVGIGAQGVQLDLDRVEVRGSTLDGVQAGDGGLISESSFLANGAAGAILGIGCSVERSKASGNTLDGLSLGDDGTASDSLFSGNGGTGVVTGIGCTLSHLRSTGNSADGIVTGAQCTVEDSICRQNSMAGIRLGPATIAVSCILFGNADGVVTGRASVVRDCSCRKNANAGILVPGRDGRIVGNSCDANDVVAIQVTGNRNHLERNRMMNHPLGLDVDGFWNVIVTTFAQENNTNYDIGEDNHYQTIYNPSGVFDQDGPWPNFNFIEG